MGGYRECYIAVAHVANIPHPRFDPSWVGRLLLDDTHRGGAVGDELLSSCKGVCSVVTPDC